VSLLACCSIFVYRALYIPMDCKLQVFYCCYMLTICCLGYDIEIVVNKNSLRMMSGYAAVGPMETKEKIPRPPNAFMIFANEWRRKLATQFPNESNKEISVRLGIMWKNLPSAKKVRNDFDTSFDFHFHIFHRDM